jgi:carboxyl-terminal processing protease
MRNTVEGSLQVRRRIAALASLFLAISFSVCLSPNFSRTSASPSESVSTETLEGRLAVFDDAWARINERYYDQKFHGLNWDEERTTFRPRAAKAESSQELYAVLRQMISSLNDPHTRVFAPDEKFDWWRPRFVTIGVTIGEVAGVPTVVKVEPKSAPQKAGIRAGDVIETINEQSALSLVKQRLAELPDPTNASLRFRLFAKLLDGTSGSTVSISWREKNGKRKAGTFTREWQQRDLGYRIKRERDYEVVEIDAFTKSIAASLTRELRDKLIGTRGLIIDLRSNGGGDAEAMSDVASLFLGVGSDLGRFTDRAGTSFTLSTHFRSALGLSSSSPTKVPLVVLTSERTASAAEIFVEALRDSKRATMIGTETCGCVLAVRTRHVLPDGGLLDVSELDYETALGQRIEGRGLKPDETVALERNDLYSGRDRAMDIAFNKLTIFAATSR